MARSRERRPPIAEADPGTLAAVAGREASDTAVFAEYPGKAARTVLVAETVAVGAAAGHSLGQDQMKAAVAIVAVAEHRRIRIAG